MYWKANEDEITTGYSLSDRFVAVGVGLIPAVIVVPLIYKIEHDRLLEKPIEQIAVSLIFWVTIIMAIGSACFAWAILSDRTVTLKRGSNVARINKSFLFLIRWRNDIPIREILAKKTVTETRDDISRNTDQLSHVSWWVQLVPESRRATWFGAPVVFWKGPGRQAVVDKAGEAHRLTGVPAFTPERTPIW
jgi:hypothetical protein